MNQREILQLAKASGFSVEETDVEQIRKLEAFAVLVQEECAKVCDRLSEEYGDDTSAFGCTYAIRAMSSEQE